MSAAGRECTEVHERYSPISSEEADVLEVTWSPPTLREARLGVRLSPRWGSGLRRLVKVGGAAATCLACAATVAARIRGWTPAVMAGRGPSTVSGPAFRRSRAGPNTLQEKDGWTGPVAQPTYQGQYQSPYPATEVKEGVTAQVPVAEPTYQSPYQSAEVNYVYGSDGYGNIIYSGYSAGEGTPAVDDFDDPAAALAVQPRIADGYENFPAPPQAVSSTAPARGETVITDGGALPEGYVAATPTQARYGDGNAFNVVTRDRAGEVEYDEYGHAVGGAAPVAVVAAEPGYAGDGKAAAYTNAGDGDLAVAAAAPSGDGGEGKVVQQPALDPVEHAPELTTTTTTAYTFAYDNAGDGYDRFVDVGKDVVADKDGARAHEFTTFTHTTTHRHDTLFCFALMQSEGYEKGLVMKLYETRVSLFECDEWSVYSDAEVDLAPATAEPALTKNVGSLKCEYGGKWQLALNTDIFVKAWKQIFADKQYLRYAWTVKVDPDSVFLPRLLRMQVARETLNPEHSVYLNNCDQGLHGPIEIISRGGMASFKAGLHKCLSDKVLSDERTLWGEDVFLRHCLKKLEVQKVDNFHLLSEPACLWENPQKDGCTSGKVAYHPFKKEEDYFKCLEQAKQAKPQTDADTTTTRPPRPTPQPGQPNR